MSGISTKNLPLRQSVDELLGNDSQDSTVRISREALTRLVGNGIAAQITNAGGMAVFATTAAGIAATTDGDYFSVPSENDVEYLILYRNDDGSATEIRRYPSAEALDNLEEQFTRLASSEELHSIRVSVDNADFSMAFADSVGNVAGGFDEQGRFVARIGQQVEQFEVETDGQYVWGITDEAGHVALGVDRDGNAAVSGLNLPGHDVRSVSTPGIAFAIADEQGRAAFIVYDDGTTSAGGGDPGPGPITHTVTWSFAEPIDDPSAELFLTWLTDSPNAKVLEYRPRGGQAWMAASSFRSRPFPVLSGKWLHTVALHSLSPDTVYDIRIPGSAYTDSVKTCPALDSIRVILASDWQLTDYSPGSFIRTIGDQVTAQSADLIIFNGDFNNSDGRFNEFWAQDYVNMFQAFHDHWRGPDGVQVPWINVMGNHEGRRITDDFNAIHGGDGTPGMLPDICSWTYSEFHDSRFARSVGTVRIRDLAAFVCLETDHTVPLPSQFEWYKEQLDQHCPQVSHVFVVGHVSPFDLMQAGYNKDTQCRTLRNDFWTYAENYSGETGTLRAFLSGHAHQVMVTPKLKVAYDPQQTPAQNDLNFYRDAEGIYNLGLGMVGGPPLRPLTADKRSNIDGQPFWDGYLSLDPDDPTESSYVTEGNISNPMWPYNNFWVLDLTTTGWAARCVNTAGSLFYEIIEGE